MKWIGHGQKNRSTNRETDKEDMQKMEGSDVEGIKTGKRNENQN